MMRKISKYTLPAALLALFGVAASSGLAQTTSEEQQRLIAVFQERMQDEAAFRAAAAAGKERSLLCATCHGVDGNSVKSEIPNLAGQNPGYIFEQIKLFAEGQRRDFVMQALTRDFSFEDKVNLAIYYTSQPLAPVAYREELASRGEAIYARSCAHCHGADGHGQAGYAQIAGQQIAYVETTLKRYRANLLGLGDPQEGARRSNADMEQVAGLLSDEDITQLAHYLARLR